MKNGKLNKVLFLVVTGISTIFLGGNFVSRKYHKWVRSKPKRYAFQTYWGLVNPVLYMTKEQYVDLLISYYQEIKTEGSNPVFNFPPKTLPLDTCVYVLGFTQDSMAAEVVCYYDWGKQGTFVKGYVFTETLHQKPPGDSVIVRK